MKNKTLKKILNSLLILILFILLINCKKNENIGFTINGEIKGDFKEYIYLKFDDKIDSALIKNNKFLFNGDVKEPIEVSLYPSSPKSKRMMGLASFMLENSKIFISLDYEKADFRGELTEFLKLVSISGSKTQELKINFERNMNQFYKENNDSAKTKILYKNLHDFISQNPKLALSGEFLLEFNNTNDYLNSKQIQSLFHLLDTSYQAKKDLNRIENIIKRRTLLDIGQISPRISFPNQNGEIIDNFQLKGKYLLLEFWASWCIPCRQTNPGLKKVYSKFKDKNFEILGISIDNNDENWKTAIKEDDLDWIQVIDSLKVSSEKFLLTSIPYNILLDENGKIIKRNIKPNKLSKFLTEQLEK
ncbi:MAG: TlpA disulfide reductase family protein [Lutibacter sp.]|uniref:TlpA disulfide reductase family protein n=1 Tax=Lutibacter sp. TaxID=1925666 RepID=UPI00299ECD92|nr:TlpA disulfide reductase family protein [Lutibacter sp.]MDX1830527.1 TlpA disulfide reductase family protein [Lutibacter sp.]